MLWSKKKPQIRLSNVVVSEGCEVLKILQCHLLPEINTEAKLSNI